MEARAVIEKLAHELQRKHPEKFPRREDLIQSLADLEEKIRDLEANQSDQLPGIKSEAQRGQLLVAYTSLRQSVRAQLEAISSADPCQHDVVVPEFEIDWQRLAKFVAVLHIGLIAAYFILPPRWRGAVPALVLGGLFNVSVLSVWFGQRLQRFGAKIGSLTLVIIIFLAFTIFGPVHFDPAAPGVIGFLLFGLISGGIIYFRLLQPTKSDRPNAPTQ